MTVSSAGVEASAPLLSRERIIAKPGFNRWLVPPAALCIHLCIGMAYGFSVFWKPLQGALLGADGKALPECSAGAVTFAEKSARHAARHSSPPSCNWSQFDLGWMYTFFFVLLGVSAAIWGGWLERVGSAQGGPRLGAVLVRRPADRRLRRLHPPAVADVARRRRHRRHRARARLHLARLHAHQMVPRPARHGDRHGHHGLRRRRHDRLAARHHPDERLRGRRLHFRRALTDLQYSLAWAGFRTATDVGVWQTFVALAAIYFVFMLIGAFGYRLPPAGWKPAGLDAAGQRQPHDHLQQRAPERRTQDAAVLAPVDHPVHERVGRHRHHRRGLAHAAGDVRRRARRPIRRSATSTSRRTSALAGRSRGVGAGFVGLISLFNIFGRYRLGLVLRPARAQADLLHLLHARRRPLCAGLVCGGVEDPRRCSSPASASSPPCTAAASPPFPPISPTCSARSSSAPSTDAC